MDIPKTVKRLLDLYSNKELLTHCGGMLLRWNHDIRTNWEIPSIDKVHKLERFVNEIPVIERDSNGYIFYHSDPGGTLNEEDVIAIIKRMQFVFGPPKSRLDLIDIGE